MALEEIRAHIKSVLEGVSGIGTVHEYERWAADWTRYLALFKTSADKINGWTITRRGTASVRDTMPTIMRNHTFIIRGIYGLKDTDESELTFQALIEAIQDAFEDEYLLGGYALNSGPMQVNVVENRMFGTILCHFAELTLPVEERVTYG